MKQLLVKNFLGSSSGSQRVEYSESHAAMKQFTQQRDKKDLDQLWILEHAPVFTLGQAADEAHILQQNNIPVYKTDRGGQVTYHSPGQWMFYTLFNLPRHGISVRDYVELLETIVIDVLKDYGIDAQGDRDAPGVYVDGAKIAAIGLRVSRGYSYHGLCFNYDFDQRPFNDINPCGYEGMQVCQFVDLIKGQSTNLQTKAVPGEKELLEKFLLAFKRYFAFDDLLQERKVWVRSEQNC